MSLIWWAQNLNINCKILNCFYFFCLLGDGEHAEERSWMAAAQGRQQNRLHVVYKVRKAESEGYLPLHAVLILEYNKIVNWRSMIGAATNLTLFDWPDLDLKTSTTVKPSTLGILADGKICIWPTPGNVCRGHSIAGNIARGLVYLHSNKIAHLDLKSPVCRTICTCPSHYISYFLLVPMHL